MNLPHQPLLHRFAIVTLLIALFTTAVGALVTSKNAGMAFRDWPTSDGQFMLTYPWLADFARDWDKFLEHGHRLAGVLIGVCSLVLCALLWWKEDRRWLRWMGVAVVMCVVIQGLIGGSRVWLDERGLAMVHGAFVAVVLSLMGLVIVATGRRWQTAGDRTPEIMPDLFTATCCGALTVAVLGVQYLLGGLIRHQGTGLHEHLTLGITATAIVLLNMVVAYRTRIAWLQRSGIVLLLWTLWQASLGGMTWVLRFGFAATGYVATADSIVQVISRTSHMVCGAIVLMTAVLHVVRLRRIAWVTEKRDVSIVVGRLQPVPAALGGER